MNQRIAELEAQVSKLDDYTQRSIYGSWAYLVNTRAINTAMRFIPKAPVVGGIDEFTPYETARAHLMREAERSPLPGLINMSREFQTRLDELGAKNDGIQGTFEFKLNNPPQRDIGAKKYKELLDKREYPSVTKEEFVAAAYEQAMKNHADLIAIGQDAVRLCETFTAIESDPPEGIEYELEEKMLNKLDQQYTKVDKVRLTASSPKTKLEILANQTLIRSLMAEYGMEPSAEILRAKIKAEHEATFPAEASDLTTVV